ncbi:N-acetylmuramidase family protein [Vibrio sp. S9_S30]|uniref:N-acetylmuramidase family protein n=1 Tax=Vibrio sp. S9_S30 TaxID=2720226 RepID=UPI0016812CAE|nr:N-acetylmuramidase family protein [Vibrio sp. S9_S30]MBD1557253.1 N-acetylmuramidase family protein [Vibrio sp. S9_S30]
MKDIPLTSSVGSHAENQEEDVLAIQKALNEAAKTIGLDEPLKEDGVIEDDVEHSKTCQAIRKMQATLLGFKKPDGRIDRDGKSHRALAEAISDELVIAPSLFLPRIEPEVGLSDEDFEKAAESLGCGVAAVKAVSEVESAGSGFFASGPPCILFEAHIFSKHSNRQFDDSHPEISSRKWDRSLYVGGEKEYERLQEAMTLDRKAALKSASYGRYQIMGFNHAAAGYDDIETFVRDMFLAERFHLFAFVSFIQSNPRMHHAIQTLDWATFARHYNGPAYAENRYDEKLLLAYHKHSG